MKIIFEKKSWTRRWLLLAAICIVTSDAMSKTPEVTPANSKTNATAQVDQVIAKGVAYLISAQKDNGSWRDCPGTTALVLKAIIFSGVPKGYETPVEKAVAYLLANSKYDRVYETALLAIALQDLDAEKYRDIIRKCAAFLQESQLPHGMWTYAKVTAQQLQTITEQISARSTENPEDQESRFKALLGDNSNTQFALLGLRAVRWAGLEVNPAVIRKTQDHFIHTQHPDGGWGYKEYGGLATGSMTCAGLASLCILDDVFKSGWYFGRRKIQKNNVAKGVQWMRDNFSVKKNPGGANYYYYLYSMERAGILTKRKQFGEHDWYAEGVQALCASQHPDGMWLGESGGRRSIEADTSFAILFLKEGAQAHSSPERIPWVDDEGL